ncbi:MAG: 3-phosphoshikimate 1-carboxyvinyltransferase [Firmicutes bacterium]|nr:3-phosphoshikimate 1-carboxyvinyltransferase [Bacillota bacterium]
MKCVKIIPSRLNGDIEIPPSKSIGHRALISAGLSKGVSDIKNLMFSDDITATLNAMKDFGAKEIEKENNRVTLKGIDKFKKPKESIDCKESGSTLRFLIPMAGLIGEEITFNGRGKLIERPLKTYYEIFKKQNIKYKNNDGKLPLTVNGLLNPGTFKVKGNISSQFISGLMFVLPLLNGDSKIIITTKLESKGYVDLTMDVLNKFGVEIENKEYKEFLIKGNQRYKSRNYRVEGDFSQAAFWIVGGLLGGNINCFNLDIDSLQGDKVILDIVKKMGGKFLIKENNIKIKPSKTKGIEIDASQCPDLVPILAVFASLSEGITKISNAKRLRIKESDRLKAISTELNKLGASVTELEDGLVIKGKEKLNGGVVDSWNDHRIAMALAIASIKCSEAVIIKGSEAINKSYPHFWMDLKKLGGKIDEWSMG